MLVRVARDPARQEGRAIARRVPADAAVVPGLLLLLARDLVAHDPPRVLAWRMLHDPRLALPSPLMPRLPGEIDRDPIALALGACAAALALAYLLAALLGARAAVRRGLIAAAAVVLVVAPTLAFVAMGAVAGRPYGQDGGVVQLPLAMDRILGGQSPYGADYSDSILGRQARVSDFWSERGGNPILHHHAYLPGTHLLMLPAYLLGRALGLFDPRFVTLLALAAAAWLAARLVAGESARLIAAAVVLLNPLVYWQQVFGANDVVIVALVLFAAYLGGRDRPLAAAAVVGLACATKQLAWPFAPFLLVHLAGVTRFGELVRGPVARRLALLGLVALAVFLAVVLPVALLDLRAFWGDIVVYNVGLPGGDNYPLGGTPGFGFANFILYAGAVSSLRDHVSFTPFYLLLVPLGLLLLRSCLRERTAAAALMAGGAALLLSLYFSRVVHPNYLILAATILPVALLMGARVPVDVVVVPLLLLALAVEVAQAAVMQGVWEDAVAVRLPAYAGGVWRALGPRAGPELSPDPLGLALGAGAAGLGIGLLVAGILGARARARLAVVATAIVLVVIVPAAVAMRVAAASGVYRAQDRWAVALRSEGGRAGAAREAWSASFRRDPPAPVAVEGGIHGPLLREPRWLTLAALALVGALALAMAPVAFRPLALGLALLAPPIAIGTVFGSGVAAVLALVLGACWLARRGWRMEAMAALVGAAVVASPGLAALGPGVGQSNLALYFGRWGAPWWVAALVTVGLLFLAARRPRGERAGSFALAALAAGSLAVLWLLPGASPQDLGIPVVLAGLAGVLDNENGRGTSTCTSTST